MDVEYESSKFFPCITVLVDVIKLKIHIFNTNTYLYNCQNEKDTLMICKKPMPGGSSSYESM